MLAVVLGGVAAGGTSLTGAPADGASAVRAIELRTQDDRPFRMADLLGRIVVMNFVYTGCGTTCPTQTESLASVQSGLSPASRARVAFVSVSIDPENDLPGSLHDFAERHGADLSNWVFLTGRPDRVRRVAGFFGGGSAGPGRDAVTNHRTVIQLFDAKGEGVLRYAGDPVDERRLLADLEAIAAPP